MNGQKTYPRCAYKETIEKSVVSIRPILDHLVNVIFVSATGFSYLSK